MTLNQLVKDFPRMAPKAGVSDFCWTTYEANE